VAGYSLEIRRSAARELEGIEPRDRRLKIIERIRALAREPHPPGTQKLAGSKNAYRIRHGDYRVLYEILEAERRIVVVKIGHRREVYR
jgi:mRNA interferase RelE/StbE